MTSGGVCIVPADDTVCGCCCDLLTAVHRDTAFLSAHDDFSLSTRHTKLHVWKKLRVCTACVQELHVCKKHKAVTKNYISGHKTATKQSQKVTKVTETNKAVTTSHSQHANTHQLVLPRRQPLLSVLSSHHRVCAQRLPSGLDLLVQFFGLAVIDLHTAAGC